MDSGNAGTLYNAAITASMQYYGIPDATITAYLGTPRVAFNSATALQQIALQRWIALYNKGSEAYRARRRFMNLRSYILTAIGLTAAGASCRSASDPSPILGASALVASDLFIAPSRLELSAFTTSEVVSARRSDGGIPNVTWSSSDTAVVTVSAVDSRSARLSLRHVGTAAVVAIAADGARAYTTVVVTEKPPTRFDPVAPRETNVDGLKVTAVTRADSAPGGVVRYTTTAAVRNENAAARTIQLGACSLWITLHVGGGWFNEEMRPLVWDQMLTDGVCGEQSRSVTLPPHASYELTTSQLAHELAAKVVSNSRYFFHAHVRFDTTEVVVGGDSAVISYPSGDLTPSAVLAISGRDTAQTIEASVTVTNTGRLPNYVEYGACTVRLLAYTDATRSGPPVWNSDLRRPWSGGFGYACILPLYTSTLPPGGSLLAGRFAAPLVEMLADSLPDGRYYFAADLGLSNRPPIRGIPAGSAVLTLPRPPLQSSRAADFLTYRASPVVSSGSPGTLTAEVGAALEFAGSSIVTFSRDCAVVVYAYRSRDRRDAAPRSGAADWTQRAQCGPTVDTTTMYKGNSRTLTTTVRISDILGASLPAGRYYFAVAVHAQGNRVMLSAGEADLAR